MNAKNLQAKKDNRNLETQIYMRATKETTMQTKRKARLSAAQVVLTLLVMAVTALLPQKAAATANYVYHERTGNSVYGGAANSCGGAAVYVPQLSPTASQPYNLRFKVEYQFYTDIYRVYYTTDGTNPSGSRGTPSGTTKVEGGIFQCTFSSGGGNVDIVRATIPGQPAGTIVKYIMGAWHSGGGPEIFANSGTCGGCGNCDNSGCATVFSYVVQGGLTPLKSFAAGEGSIVYSGLVEGNNGALFGTTVYGGTGDNGTIYRINRDGTGFTVMKRFSGFDGANPYGTLLRGSDGVLYGTTFSGGLMGAGTVYKINQDGSGFSVMADMAGGGAGPSNPFKGLVEGTDGFLYGTTIYGGTSDLGTVYRIGRNGQDIMVIKSFAGFDGARPFSPVIQGQDGWLYGMTREGGPGGGNGTVFKLSADGTGFAVLRSLSGFDGQFSEAGLMQASDGVLYGVTTAGGTNNQGGIFKLNTDGSGFARIKSFNGIDGGELYSSLIQGNDGALYGTTRTISTGPGSIYRLGLNGTSFSVLKTFAGPDGAYPYGRLLQATDGALYGTTQQGGSGNLGTVYKLNIGAPATISTFSPGSGPVGTEITVTGIGWGSVAAITFNGVQSTPVASSFSTLTAKVPVGATTGKIAIFTSSGNATSSVDFIVTKPPTISGFSPVSGPVGAEVTISGGNLDTVTGVTFNGLSAAAPTVVSASSIKVVVPVGATTGKIAVTGPDGAATSSGDFTVCTPPIFEFGNKTTSTQPGKCTGVIKWPAIKADGTLVCKSLGGAVPADTIVGAGYEFPKGVTTVECTETDACGSGSGTFTVTVNDTEAPVIASVSPITVTATSAEGTAVTFAATATDNCDANVVVTCEPRSGSVFPVGTRQVKCEAYDESRNAAVASTFDVTVTAPQVADNRRYSRASVAGLAYGTEVPPGSGQFVGINLFGSLQDAINACPADGVIHVAAGTYNGITLSRSIKLELAEGAVVQGASPALVLSSGSITISGGTLTTATDDPTILLNGGTLTLQNVRVQETVNFDRPAIQVTGGQLNMGYRLNGGSNTVNINGAGSLIRNEGPNMIPAIGNTWKQDGVAITSNGTIEDEIFHANDVGGGGLVSWTGTPITIAPGDLASGKPEFSAPHGTGTNAFGYDWDSARPDVGAGAPAGYGFTSFSANVVNDNTGAGPDSAAYRTIRIAPTALFGHSVKIKDVADLLYQTKKLAAQTTMDWRVTIYTTSQGAGDSGSFYRSRLQSLPYQAASLNAPGGQWNSWSLGGAENQLRFYQNNRPGFSAPDIAWSELAAGPVTRGASTWDWSNEEVMMIDITLGANAGGGTVQSQLDGILVALTTGQIADINLEQDLTVTPHQIATGDLATGKPQFSPPHGTGTNAFGYDWDSATPDVAAGAPSGYGFTSFSASVVNDNTGAGPDAASYRTIRIAPTALFGHSVKIKDLANLLYQTKKLAPQTAIDWRITVYTTFDGSQSGNSGSFYRSRLQANPYEAANLNAPAGQWNGWSLGGPVNKLRFFQSNRTGFSTPNLDWYELTAGTVTRGANSWDYSNEEVMMIDITLGANAGGGTAQSQVDGIQVSLTSGEVADINLEQDSTVTPITIAPADLATGKPQFSAPHGTGTNAFGYDWDSAAPDVAADAPSGYGVSSFAASVVNDNTGTGPDAAAYRTLRIAPTALFGHSVKIKDLANLLYQTKKFAPQTTMDWRVTVYTTHEPSLPGNSASWYRSRLQSLPYEAANLNAPAGQWNSWSVGGPNNRLVFSQINRTGFGAADISWYELTAGPVTRGANTWDWSNEEVMMIDITLGANSGGGTVESRLDGVVISLVNGQTVDINLEQRGVTVTQIVIGTSSLATGKPEFSPPHGTGTNAFGYDWDSATPDGAAGAPSGYGYTSFGASVVNDNTGSGPDANAYRTIRIAPTALFGRSVKVEDLLNLAYQTKKLAAQNTVDWRVTVYTTREDSNPGNSGSFYRSRLQANPYEASSLNAPAGQWNTWSLIGPNNKLRFYQSNRTGFSTPDLNWHELTAGPVSRGVNTWDYSQEEVMMIDITLGANSGGGTAESQVDAIQLTLTSGEVADINLEQSGPVVNYTLGVPDLAATKAQFSPPHSTGTNPFGFDWDSRVPEIGVGAPSGYGTASFAASVVNDNTGAGPDASAYRTFRFAPNGVFGHSVKVKDVANLMYQTLKTTPQTAIDWRVTIYTTREDSNPGNSGSFYRSRLQANPYEAASLNAPAGQWNTWSLGGANNKLRFYQSNRTGFGTPDLDWYELTAGPVTRGASTWDYSEEEVMMIDITLGANAGGGTAQSQLDAIVMVLASGETANINLEPVQPNATFVDDSYTTSNTGGHYLGYNAFNTVQEGVNAVTSSGTVTVLAGTYHEDVSITKTVHIVGAGAGQSIVSGAIGGSVATFHFLAEGIVLEGFTITRDGNNTTDWNNPGLNTTAIAIQSLSSGTVRNCEMVGNRTGIDINNASNIIVQNNKINDNRTGMIMRNKTDNLVVTENEIMNNWTAGVLFLDASGGSNSPLQQALNCNFSNNSISGNWYGEIVDRQSGGSLPAAGTNLKNFSGNWLGTTTPVVTTANSTEPGYAAQIPVAYGGTATPPGGQPTIAGPASANIDYTPFLHVGTDTSATFGFQGDFHTLHVVATGAQVGTTGRIQEGVNSVSGSIVLVGPGTFTENVVVDSNIQIIGSGSGTGAGDTIIAALASSNPVIDIVDAGGTGAGDRLTIKDLRTSGGASGIRVSATTAARGYYHFENVAAVSSTGSGIGFEGPQNISEVEVVSSLLSGNNYGLRVGSSVPVFSSLQVTGGQVNNNAFGGISINPNGSDATDATHHYTGVTVDGTAFSNNGTPSQNGTGDVILFRYNGDAALKNVTIVSGGHVPILIRGEGLDANPGSWQDSGTVLLQNVTVTGTGNRAGVYISNYKEVTGITFDNVDLSGYVPPSVTGPNASFAAALQFQHVGAQKLNLGKIKLPSTVVLNAGLPVSGFFAAAPLPPDSGAQATCDTIIVGATTPQAQEDAVVDSQDTAMLAALGVPMGAVGDITFPAFSIATANQVFECTGGAGTVANYTLPTVTDDCVYNINCSPVSGSVFALGSTTVNCTVTDTRGLSVNSSFTVTIADTTVPLVSCPADIVKPTVNNAGVTVTFSATATDVCDGTPSVSCTPSSGSSFAVGATTVSCTATDDSGNSSAACSFTVTIVDTVAQVKYVDDDWTGQTAGTQVEPGKFIGYNAFATIQGAVNAADPADTILVAAGNYPEDVNVNKALTLTGAGAGQSTIVGQIGGDGATVRLSAAGSVLEGFTITRAGNNTTDWTNGGLNSAGVAIQGQASGNNTIRFCLIEGNRTGIDLNNVNNVTVKNNQIVNNRTGMVLRNQTDNLMVMENEITGNWTVGLVFLDASSGSNVPVQTAANCSFSNNNISGNWYGQIVDRQTGGALPAPGSNVKNFSGNWLGTTSPVVTTANSAEPGYNDQIPVVYGGTATAPGGQPDLAGAASANTDYTPMLASGTDTSATYGFQGDFHTLHVVSSGSQSGSTGRIQEGVNSVSGSTVVIGPGNYSEKVVLNAKIVLDGAGSGSNPAVDTIITSATASTPVIRINAGGASTSDRLVIQDVRVTGATGSGNQGSGILVIAGGSYYRLENVVSTGNAGHGFALNHSGANNDIVITLSSFSGNGGTGFRVPTTASIDGLTVTDSQFDGNAFGFETYMASGSGTFVKNVSISGSSFNNNTFKGIYAEKLSDATLQCLTVNNSGTSGGFSAGIDINLKYAAYQNISISDSLISNCGTSDLVNGAGLTIKARDDAPSYSAVPASLTGVIVSGLIITGSPDAIRFGESGKNNVGPTGVTVENCSLAGNTRGLRNESQAGTDAENNWWGSVTGPTTALNAGGSGSAVSGSVDFSPWLGDSTDTSGACGFQPNATPVYYRPDHLVFSTQPGWGQVTLPLSTQPVVQVIDENNAVAAQFQGPVTLAIGNNPSSGVLGGTATINAANGVASFSGLSINLAGAGYTLVASATDLASVTSSAFDIYNQPTVVYVDDDYTPSNAGGHIWGYDAFATIQGGINAVTVAGTVNVAAGNYHEDILVNKQVLVTGAGAGQSVVYGVIGGDGATFRFASTGAIVEGFTITRDGNNTTDWNNPNLNSTGVAFQGLTVNGTVRNCLIIGNRTGVDINNAGGITLRNNVINNNRTGLIMRNQTDNLTVVENEITDNWTVGVLFLDASGGSNSPIQTAANCTFSNNNISGNWYGEIVDRQSGGSLPAPGSNLKNFSGNWLGTTSPVVTTANSAEPGYAAQIPVLYGGSAVAPGGQPTIAGPASANIDCTPFLHVGTDTSATMGFQGDFHTLHVVATGAQTGGTGRIQEGINSVSGSTVLVSPGTYVENIVIGTHNLDLSGAGVGSSIIQPAVSDPNCGGAGGGSLCSANNSIIVVKANNVKIHGFTLNGDNPALTSGVVRSGADVDARNGIITDHTAGVWNGLEIYNTEVKNVYLRGIYASSGGSFNFHNNLVQNVKGDGASIGIFNFGGSGVIAYNAVSDANDAIAANWSTGTQFLTNTVTAAGSGVHTDNNGGSGGVADLIQGNQVSAMSANAYGIWVFSPYVAATVNANTISDCAVGLAMAGQGAAAAPVFSNNSVTTGIGGDSVGAYETTSLFGFGSSAASAVFQGNTISGTAYGFYLEAEPTYALGATIKNNSVTANSYGVFAQGGLNKALLENNDLTGNTVAGIHVEGGALVDAGDCSGGNVTGLGSSVGGNVLTGYGLDDAAPWAIENLNSSSQSPVYGYNNNYAAAANLEPLFYDDSDTAGANSQVLYSQAAALVVSCPANITVECVGNVPAGATTLAAFNAQGGTASASAASVSFSDNNGVNPSTGEGTIVRTYTVTDSCGQTMTCAQTIIVDDTILPMIACANVPAQSAFASVTCTATVPDVRALVRAESSDNCTANAGLVIAQVPAEGSSVTGTGAHPILVSVTDAAGNTTSCTVAFNVIDNTPPTITCPTDLTDVPTDAGQCYATSVVLGTPMTADNCMVASVVNNAPSQFPKGETLVTWTVTDASGNTAMCTQKVIVQDHEQPVIACPANVTKPTDAGQCTAVVSGIAPVSQSDNCAVASVTYVLSGATTGSGNNNASGTAFNKGVTTVAYTITDTSGNTASCSFTVTVNDEEVPVVTLPPNITVQCDVALTPADTGGSATAADNCDPNPNVTFADTTPVEVTASSLQGWVLGTSGTASTTFTAGPATAPLGSGSVRLAVGADGNSAAQVRTPAYNGVLLSKLTELSYQTYRTQDGNGGQMAYILLNVDLDGNGSVDDQLFFEPEYQRPAYNPTLPDQGAPQTGIWQTWDALRGGWWSVNSLAGLNPGAGVKPLSTYIAANPNARLATTAAGSLRFVAGFGAGAWDNFIGSVDAIAVGTNGLTLVYDLDDVAGGTCANTTVVRTWTATDASGNSSSSSQLIRVVDTVAPMITSFPANMTVNCVSEVPAANDSLVVASDACSSPVVITHDADVISAQTCANRYTITRTYHATDACGNTVAQSQTITVDDQTKPVLVATTIGVCYPDAASAEAAALAATSVSDNCGGMVNKTVLTTGDPCNATITVTATDECGNSDFVTYNTRIDGQAPVISAVSATESAVNVKNCAVTIVQGVVQISVQAADNCSLVGGHPSIALVNGSTTEAATFVNESPAGTYNYTWTVGAGTANGTWTATVSASDLCATTTSTLTLCVNKVQLTGLVQLEGFVGGSRTVTFVATGGTSTKTWNLNLSFIGTTASYVLTDVPEGTTGISAKTAWNLREKLPVTLDVNGQAAADFVADGTAGWSDATDHYLRGGDLVNDNQIKFTDYSVLGNNFFTMNAVADINGDGQVDYDDYYILYVNWFTAGDAQ